VTDQQPPNQGPGAEIRLDGYAVPRVETPATGADVAQLLAEAAEQGSAVIPVGGGTRLGLGNPPTSADLAISMAGMNRVLSHEPEDLTLSVEAGVTIADLQQALGERGQWLPIEAPLIEQATIGGLIATAFSGPRRLGSDSLRDLIVGISVAHPTGAVSKAGGTVVKNVTGFDMMRLYHGSLGTLGVIVSANFKVLPRPRAEATRFTVHDSIDTALAAARQLLNVRGRPVAMEILQSDASGQWLMAARYEGREGTVRIMVDEAGAATGRTERILDGAESAVWWQEYVDFYSSGIVPDRVVARASCRPRAVHDLAASARTAMTGIRGASIRVSPGLGRIDVAMPADGVPSDRRENWFTLLGEHAESLVLYDAPPEWKVDFDVWGPQPETIDLMRSLKEQFDPGRVLNPGRFAGFI
jgi:glycolate oxidase FAD binding subunit